MVKKEDIIIAVDPDIKRNGLAVFVAPSHKMDNVAALVDALYCFDLTEGRVTE